MIFGGGIKITIRYFISECGIIAKKIVSAVIPVDAGIQGHIPFKYIF